jgi:hypothetical protein
MDALNNCAGTVHRQRADAEELRAAEELGEERAKQEMQLRTAEDRLPSTFIGRHHPRKSPRHRNHGPTDPA